VNLNFLKNWFSGSPPRRYQNFDPKPVLEFLVRDAWMTWEWVVRVYFGTFRTMWSRQKFEMATRSWAKCFFGIIIWMWSELESVNSYGFLSYRRNFTLGMRCAFKPETYQNM
jgi:hypothetical protein